MYVQEAAAARDVCALEEPSSVCAQVKEVSAVCPKVGSQRERGWDVHPSEIAWEATVVPAVRAHLRAASVYKPGSGNGHAQEGRECVGQLPGDSVRGLNIQWFSILALPVS